MNAAIEADDAHPSLKKTAAQLLDMLRGSVITILDNGIRYKQLRPNINKQYYATIIIASLEGAIMMSKLKSSDEDIKHVLKHLESLVQEIAL
jgi:hypothetical protein